MKVVKFEKVVQTVVNVVNVEMTVEQATLLFQLYGVMLGGLSQHFTFLNDLQEVAGGVEAWGSNRSPFYGWGVDNARRGDQ